MAYRWEKNRINNQAELVIDGFEKGIADSPYQGIASLKNLNIKYYPQVTYVNYKQKAASLTGGTQIAYDTSDYIGGATSSGGTRDGVIARDANSHGGNNTSQLTASWSHTCTGANLILFVGSTIDNSVTVTGVTYNGKDLTLANVAQSSGRTTYLHYLINPDTGANTVVVTRSTTTGTLDTTASSYTGVDQTNPIDVTAVSTTTTSNPSISLTTATDGDWIVAQTGVNQSSGSLTASTNNSAITGGLVDGQNYGIWDTNSSQSTAGSKSMAWSGSNITLGTWVLVAFKPHFTNTTTNVSKSFTTSGTNRLLIVQASSTNGAFTSVSYNAVALTKLVDAFDSNSKGQSLWYLINPTVGANTLTATYTNTTTSSVNVSVNAISYNGVKQSGFPDASTSVTTIPASSQSLSLTTQTSNCWTLLSLVCNPNTTATMGAGTTQRQNNTTSSNQVILADSNAVIETPSSTTLSASFSGSVTDTTAIMVSFAPVATLTQLKTYAQSPLGLIYLIDGNGNIQKQDSVGATTFTLLTGSPSVGASGQGIAFWNNYLIVFRSTSVDYCGDGTGDAGITSSNWNTATSWPIALTASVSLTGTPAKGALTATLSANWTKPTGTYKATIALTGGPPSSQTISPKLTNGATTITWPEPLALAANTGAITNVTLLNDTNHTTFISSNDNNLYFTNGSSVGAIAKDPNYTFNPLVPLSYSVNYSSLGLPDYETVSCLSELRTNLLVGGVKKIYPWDRVSTSWQTPIPITEPLHDIINILNNIYVFAGNKGNVYFSNGYSVAPIKKIPDSFFGQIDPQITWGGKMAHRNRLWFQVYATNSSTGTCVGAGIMSYDIASQALNFENENSPGFLLTGTAGAGNVLIDVSDTSSSQYDNYFSSWYNNSTGGLDYNNTTLYANSEPQIETDLIPVGTYLQSKGFQSVEFKLDEPMATGDSISIYVRQSLSDTYTLLGTTTTSTLSDLYGKFTKASFEWAQFKITFSCASSNSSFIRLREIRIR